MESTIKIYYYTDAVATLPFAFNIIFSGNVDPRLLENEKYYSNVHTFTKNVGDDVNKFLDDLFAIYNSDQNPLSTVAMQKYIQEKNTHTSMSVGDVIYIDGIPYSVSGFGFKKMTIL
uniref:Uncharacterized protein n=1 Tax=viral metagenome TaxID=1070528 RepID=A0A6C0C9X1_9ZZZZ